ncbi:hypothetical protein AB0H83_28805 [Dactylosporangium sp. NPDC050688]|uniref:hypothetical protein n=1 Tax=Dactylosporangium sp. NPDC050688 TaxID=3157217 RepID=UPI0033ED7FDE
MPDTTKPRLRCPLCEGERFDREDGRLSIRNGSTDQRAVLLICRRCKPILPFLNRQSFFDDGTG